MSRMGGAQGSGAWECGGAGQAGAHLDVATIGGKERARRARLRAQARAGSGGCYGSAAQGAPARPLDRRARGATTCCWRRARLQGGARRAGQRRGLSAAALRDGPESAGGGCAQRARRRAAQGRPTSTCWWTLPHLPLVPAFQGFKQASSARFKSRFCETDKIPITRSVDAWTFLRRGYRVSLPR